ncbi:hypothetical protein F5Y09DRAFT_86376 [Xylaria sp. FL1042]|nr:hypothetical protein F5Y09DRAFT_86376 [Xylaria sp. FL1042]
MAPNYSLYSGYSVTDALEMAGKPQDDAQYEAGEPPVSFFTHPPQDCPAVFSTLYGRNNFRFVENPVYTRQGGYWWAAEIQRVCDELRRNLPETCRHVEAPQTYWDLYKYFDAYDIYYRGAQNLWNVINTLVYENEYAQQIVDNEQRMQTEQHIPLFEHLTTKLLRKPEIQTKLWRWEEAKQPDILKALTTDDLRLGFTAYDTYPEHFLEAIRVIFRKHYEVLRNKGFLAPRLNSVEGSDIDVPYRLNALRHHLADVLDDPFMDKFEIPNKIINGIVIANGTSQPAPPKFGYKPAIYFTKTLKRPEGMRAIQRNGINELRPALDAPAKDVNPCSENRNGTDVTNGISASERCASAPIIGGDPASIIIDSVTDKACIYTNDGRDVDNKLMEFGEPTTPKGTSADTQNARITPQASMHAIGNHSIHNSSTLSQGHVYPQNNFRGPGMPPSQLPEARDRTMSHDAFSNQFPAYTLPKQHMQAHPAMIQQTQYAGPIHLEPNGGGYAMNATPPYIQSGMRQQYSASAAPTGGFGEYKRNFDTLNHSNGKWQHVGSDDIHGPKAIFRKDSVHSPEVRNHKTGQRKSRESFNESSRHTSTTSTSSEYSRFSNTHPQQYNSHVNAHQTGGWRAPVNASQSFNKYGCVNAYKRPDTLTKFDPCSCHKCSDNDRTIFVSKFPTRALETEEAKERLKQHFSKFGEVESVYPANTLKSAARVRFVSIPSTLAAARDHRVQIQGFGDITVSVQFGVGSQFFTPVSQRDHTYGPSKPGHSAQIAPQEYQAVVPQPQNIGPSNFDALSRDFQRHSLHEDPGATSESMAPRAYNSGTDTTMEPAMSISDREATPSGLGKEMAERPPYTEPGLDPTVTLQSLHGPASTDLKDLHGTPGNNAPRAEDTSRNEEENPIQQPESTDLATLDEEASIDYGTVRIRPEKARYETIPSYWRRNLTPPNPRHEPNPQSPQTTSQSDQISVAKETCQVPPSIPSTLENSQAMKSTKGKTTTNSLPHTNDNENSSENELMSEHLETSAHTKRKASEPREDEEAPSQWSPKKKFAKIVKSDSSAPESHGSQFINDDQQIASQTKAGKKKKNRKKNRENEDIEAPAPETTSTPAFYESQTFQPVISTSDLPRYPQESMQEMESKPIALHISPPVRVWRPRANQNTRPHGIEPFPAYRDAMSSPQRPVHRHKSSTTGSGLNRSISSNASTIIQDSSQNLYGLNPGTHNFVPVSADTTSKNSTAPTPPLVSQVNVENADDSKASQVTSRDNGCRANMSNGTRRGGGTNKYKSGWKTSRQSMNTQALTDKGLFNVKAEASKPTEAKDIRNWNRFQALTDQKVRTSRKQSIPDDANNKLPSAHEAQPKESVNHDNPEKARVDRQDKEKGKEVISPKKKPEATTTTTTTTETKPKNDKTESKYHKRSKSQIDPGSPKKAPTISHASNTSSSSSSSSSLVVPASTKPKQGKTKSRGSPKKNTATHLDVKANNTKPENKTSKGPNASSSQAQQGSKGPKAQPAKPDKSILNADDFPALPPKPAVALAPIPLCFSQIANPWQKVVRRPTPALSPTPVAKTKDGEGEGEGKGESTSTREKRQGIPDDERKGG